MTTLEIGSPAKERRVGKLVVVGQPMAGKSTLIDRLCQRPLNLEVGGRTVAMDHGMLEVAGHTLSVVGVPGQERFAGVQDALAEGALLAIWVRRFPWPADRRSVESLSRLGLPTIQLLNLPFRKQLRDELADRTPEPSLEPVLARQIHSTVRGDLLGDLSWRGSLLEALADCLP